METLAEQLREYAPRIDGLCAEEAAETMLAAAAELDRLSDGVALNAASHPLPEDINPDSVETAEVELPEVRQRPTNGTRAINDDGIGFFGVGNERMKDIRVYAENGCVMVWAEIHSWGDVREACQYLNPVEAMAFAKAFERCAIQALKDIA